MVWEARQLSLDRLVAVKVYQRELDEARQRNFVREAAAAGRLSAHPGIVTTYAAGILPDDRPYLVMELCPGGSLTTWLRPENRPNEERVRQVGLQIADALAAAHASGVLHRDVKPANILIDGYGNPRLADFGLAAVEGAEADSPEALWVTPAWAPPETFRMQPATEAGDVFSLAATLYALLSGSPPRTVSSASSSFEQMVEVAKRPISPIPGVSISLMEVLLAALDDDPAVRPSAAAFFGQLAKVPLRTSKREAVVGGSAAASSVIPPGQSAVPEHSAGSNGHSLATAPVAPQTQPAPAQVGPAGRSRWREKRRLGLLALAAALVIGIASVTTWLIDEPASSGVPAPVTQQSLPGGQPSSVDPSQASASEPPTSTATRTETGTGTGTGTGTPASGDRASSASAAVKAIQFVDPVGSAKPYQAVRIQGTYQGGPGIFLRVQRWEQGSWLDFPVPTVTDRSGQFTAHVEFGLPGRYRLRMVDPDSGMKSEPFVLVVRN